MFSKNAWKARRCYHCCNPVQEGVPQVPDRQTPPPEGERPNKKFKGGGKARGKGFGKPQANQDSFVRIPKELLALGSVAATPKGHRLCFSYNLKACGNPVDKQRCSKGLHACAVKGCHGQHPAVECTRAKRD